ncbi:MAG: hypothetical protein PVJ67_02950 [Candidatus Pacearchaeota archaeon]|jgi:hypothetical protein
MKIKNSIIKDKNNVTPLDVVRVFYAVDEFLKEEVKKAKKPISKTQMKRILERVCKKVMKVPKKKLITYHFDWHHPRYDNYFNSKWRLETISLKDCGVYPGLRRWPLDFSKGNVFDTAKMIKPYIKNKNKLTWNLNKILYLEGFLKYAEIINEYFPMIVLEDHVIRHAKYHDKSIRNSHKKTKYDIDDGCNRAIALALNGERKVLALVGKRIYKSPYVYD